MIKATVIKRTAVEEAKTLYGEDSVNKIFELIQHKIPKKVMEDLEDENLKKCLLHIFEGDLDK